MMVQAITHRQLYGSDPRKHLSEEFYKAARSFKCVRDYNEMERGPIRPWNARIVQEPYQWTLQEDRSKKVSDINFSEHGSYVGCCYWSSRHLDIWHSSDPNPYDYDVRRCVYPYEEYLCKPNSIKLLTKVFKFKWLPWNNENTIGVLSHRGRVGIYDLKQKSFDCLEKSDTIVSFDCHRQIPFFLTLIDYQGQVKLYDIRAKERISLTKIKKERIVAHDAHYLTINPANCNEFSVGGAGISIYVMDRRKLDKCLKQLRLTKDLMPRSDHTYKRPQDCTLPFRPVCRVACLTYDYTGKKLAASFGIDGSFLFKTNMTFPVRQFTSDNMRPYGVLSLDPYIDSVKFFGPNSEMILASYISVDSSDLLEERYHTKIIAWDCKTGRLMNHMTVPSLSSAFSVHPTMPIIATGHSHRGILFWSHKR